MQARTKHSLGHSTCEHTSWLKLYRGNVLTLCFADLTSVPHMLLIVALSKILRSHCGVEIQDYNWISLIPLTKQDTEATHLKRFKNILGDYLSASSSCQVSPCVFPRVLIKNHQTNKSIWCASHTQQVPLCCSLMLSKIRRELCSQLPGLQPITSHCFPPLGQSCASPAPPSHPSSSFASSGSSCCCWEFTLWWTSPKSLKTEMNCCNIYRLIQQLCKQKVRQGEKKRLIGSVLQVQVSLWRGDLYSSLY